MEDSLFKYMELWVLNFCGYNPFENPMKVVDLFVGKQSVVDTFKFAQFQRVCGLFQSPWIALSKNLQFRTLNFEHRLTVS